MSSGGTSPSRLGRRRLGRRVALVGRPQRLDVLGLLALGEREQADFLLRELGLLVDVRQEVDGVERAHHLTDAVASHLAVQVDAGLLHAHAEHGEIAVLGDDALGELGLLGLERGDLLVEAALGLDGLLELLLAGEAPLLLQLELRLVEALLELGALARGSLAQLDELTLDGRGAGHVLEDAAVDRLLGVGLLALVGEAVEQRRSVLAEALVVGLAGLAEGTLGSGRGHGGLLDVRNGGNDGLGIGNIYFVTGNFDCVELLVAIQELDKSVLFLVRSEAGSLGVPVFSGVDEGTAELVAPVVGFPGAMSLCTVAHGSPQMP